MKNKRKKLTRRTLASLVSTLPLPLAKQAARHGRTLKTIEAAAVNYLDTLHWCNLAAKHKDVTASKAFGLGARDTWEFLEFEVMSAIQDRDSDALHTLADIVKSYRYKAPNEDKTRRELLAMLEYHQSGGRAITAKEVAERWLNYPEGADLSRLRAIAKQVGYSFAPNTVGRPRKRQTRKVVS